jgi:hypothetical protein
MTPPVPCTPEDIISTPAQKRRKKKARAGKPRPEGKPREPQARSKWLTASVTDLGEPRVRFDGVA